MSNIEGKVVGARQVIARLKGLSPEVRERGKAAIARFSYAVRDQARKKYDEVGLHVRTGALRGGITALPVTETAHQIVGKVVAGQKLPYARIQEYGGTITAKKAKFLAIPLDAAKTAAGVARFAPRQADAAGYESTFVRNGVLFGKQGDTVVLLFALKRSVTLPARSFMRSALAALRPQIEAGLKEVVMQVANESQSGTSP